MARIRSKIAFDNTDLLVNPMALVEVRLTPDGTIISRKLLKSSGLPLYDEAVLRAIDKAERLPRENGEQVPSSLTIEFRPKDRG